MEINPYIRFFAALRRVQFDLIKSTGVFWLFENGYWLDIKEPWKTLYCRDVKRQTNDKRRKRAKD